MTGFVVYDLTFLILFCLFLTIFLIRNRKNIKREGIMILYRTKVGLNLIEKTAKRFNKFLNKSEIIIIIFGYLLMATVVLLLGQIIYLFVKIPNFASIVKIPPIVPLIPYLPEIFKADFLPSFYFTYWIIALAITAIVHEFFHGIYARIKNIKIKSTGFAFLGPFTAFFVEPDENKVKKLRAKDQLAFIAAGSFSNLLLTFIFGIIMWLFFVSFFSASGVIFNTYSYNILNSSEIVVGNETKFINFDGGLNLTKVNYGSKIYYLNNEQIKNLDSFDYVIAYENSPALNSDISGIIISIDDKEIKQNKDLQKALEMKRPNETVKIKTFFNNSELEYKVVLSSRPDNKSKAYLGVAFLKSGNSFFGKIRERLSFFKDANTYYKPNFSSDFILFIYNLIWWIVLINFSVAVGNMMPVGIADGGRFFYLTILGITKSKKLAKIIYKIMTYLVLAIFAFLTLKWFLAL